MTESLFDDCGHPEHVSQSQITRCLLGNDRAVPFATVPTGPVVDVALPPAKLATFVAGQPAPQGSKRGFVNRHTGRVSMVESSKAVKPWRESIRAALLDDDGRPRATFDSAVIVELRFVLRRPASTPKRRTPPAVKKPDIDKLARAVLDAIGSAGVWHDDSQVTQLAAMKRLAGIDETPGLHLAIRDAP